MTLRRDALAWLVIIIGFLCSFVFAVMRAIYEPYDPLLMAGMYGSGLGGSLLGFLILRKDERMKLKYEEDPEYKLNDGDYCAHPECAQGVLQEVCENTVECQSCYSLFNMTTGEMLKDGEKNEGIDGVKSDGLDDLYDDEE